ncbi:hypothetical protein RD792_013018 [Penstemon davidsonii]|uniref:Uncharacterized protein n=1 Tax=Penstemon davidsonii TaxID=160366 RepID=A0ABR0CSD6_9LAMI|nr:hypothetical protein RD792_013018 [Penstemon davidsonii]
MDIMDHHVLVYLRRDAPTRTFTSIGTGFIVHYPDHVVRNLENDRDRVMSKKDEILAEYVVQDSRLIDLQNEWTQLQSQVQEIMLEGSDARSNSREEPCIITTSRIANGALIGQSAEVTITGIRTAVDEGPSTESHEQDLAFEPSMGNMQQGVFVGKEVEIDVLASLLSGRLVRERIGPAMLSAVQSQMGAVEITFEEVPANIFDTGGAKGLLVDTVEKIPKFIISKYDNVDTLGEEVSCSVCLQVFLHSSFGLIS